MAGEEGQDGKPAMSPTKRVLMIVYTTVMAFYGIFNMAMAISAYTNFDKITTNFQVNLFNTSGE